MFINWLSRASVLSRSYTVHSPFWHIWPCLPIWVALLLIYFWGTAIFPNGVPCIDFGFSMESVSPVFSTSEKYTCYAHKKLISVISMCLKQASLQEGLYGKNVIWWFLKMTLFAVSYFTWSYFQNQWTDLDNVCIILMRKQCHVICCKNLNIAESIHATHFGRQGHIYITYMDLKHISSLFQKATLTKAVWIFSALLCRNGHSYLSPYFN